MRVCVIGIGNELRGDDGVGLVTLRELKAIFRDSPIELLEAGDHLFDIPEIIMGFDIIVIIDALPPGLGSEMIRTVDFDPDSLPVRETFSLHDMDLLWQLGYACRNGFQGKVILVGIMTFSLEYRREFSPELIKFLPEISLKIAGIIQQILTDNYISSPISTAIGPKSVST